MRLRPYFKKNGRTYQRRFKGRENDQVSSKTRSYPSTSLEEDKELEDIFVQPFIQLNKGSAILKIV